MNKIQKIIITFYLILSPLIGICTSYCLTFLNKINGIFFDTSEFIIGSFIAIAFFFIFLGIITLILYKLWADKK